MADTSSTHTIHYKIVIDDTGVQSSVDAAKDAANKKADTVVEKASTTKPSHPKPSHPKSKKVSDNEEQKEPETVSLLDDMIERAHSAISSELTKAIGKDSADYISSHIVAAAHNIMSSHPIFSHIMNSTFVKKRIDNQVQQSTSQGDAKLQQAASEAQQAASSGEGIGGAGTGDAGIEGAGAGGAAGGLLMGGAIAISAVVLITVISKLVKVMNSITQKVAQYNPTVFGQMQMYGLEKRMVDINYARQEQPLATAWLNIKSSLLSMENQAAPLIGDISNVAAKGLNWADDWMKQADIGAQVGWNAFKGFLKGGIPGAYHSFFDGKHISAGTNTLNKQALSWNHAFVTSLASYKPDALRTEANNITDRVTPPSPVEMGVPGGAANVLQRSVIPINPPNISTSNITNVNLSQVEHVDKIVESIRSELIDTISETDNITFLAAAMLEGRPVWWSS